MLDPVLERDPPGAVDLLRFLVGLLQLVPDVPVLVPFLRVVGKRA